MLVCKVSVANLRKRDFICVALLSARARGTQYHGGDCRQAHIASFHTCLEAKPKIQVVSQQTFSRRATNTKAHVTCSPASHGAHYSRENRFIQCCGCD